MTPCHSEGGCIRAFEDDTCGDQGQCSIVLAILAERERCAKLIEAGFSRPGIKTKHDSCAHGRFGWEDCEQCAADAIRRGEV